MKAQMLDPTGHKQKLSKGPAYVSYLTHKAQIQACNPGIELGGSAKASPTSNGSRAECVAAGDVC